jgi:hypothetical protein
LAGNAAGSVATLAGVGAASGFILFLNGALGALVLAGLGLALSQLAWVRGRFAGPAAWGALCAGLLAGVALLALSLDRFGVLAGTVRGARAALLAGLGLGLAALAAGVVFALAHVAWQAASARLARRLRLATAGLLGLAALLPLAFAVLGMGR